MGSPSCGIVGDYVILTLFQGEVQVAIDAVQFFDPYTFGRQKHAKSYWPSDLWRNAGRIEVSSLNVKNAVEVCTRLLYCILNI